MSQFGEIRIVIVGGGFGGVQTALELSKKKLPNAKIVLISDKPHFEYHAALYRVVTGRSPLEVCIPLSEIFDGDKVEIIEDKIDKVNLTQKTLLGESGFDYRFDYLVLAMGAETAYFNIPGLEEYSFGFKSIHEAIKLKNHLHQTFAEVAKEGKDKKPGVIHIVIVGAGPSGTELAGELAIYTKTLSKNHNLDPSLVVVDLIEAANRILPTLPAEVGQKIETRLRMLGVNIFVNCPMLEEEVEQIRLKGMQVSTETVIWTAGVTANSLFGKISGLEFDKTGRVLVDDYLAAKGQKGIFVVGDGAATPFTGMAQTAIVDGKLVADNIENLIINRQLKKYQPKKPAIAIPVGEDWAAVVVWKFKIYGKLGWILRRFADLKYFLSILPIKKALLAFQGGKTLCETCPACLSEIEVAAQN